MKIQIHPNFFSEFIPACRQAGEWLVLMKTKKVLFLLIGVPVLLSGCLPRVGQDSAGGKDEYIKGAVAPGFPALPSYEGAEIVESYGFSGKFGAIFMANDDLDKVVKFYGDSLPKLGWETSLEETSANFVFQIKNEKQEGSVIVNTAQDGRTTAITIAVSPRPQ
ncbi:hypothetical protein HYW40_02780 [Candidatus Curtissbacteria bacterium]|nr:hypothetical protein [Candidatus Curtissbacteria bacterium]